MSIKIYNAMRIDAPRLNEFLDWARTQMRNKVKERIEELMASVKPEVLGECPAHFKSDSRDVVAWERRVRLRKVMEMCRKAANATQRTVLFDIECGVNLWLYQGKFYAVPIGEYWIVDTLKDLPPWVEEYHYQNQTDRPDEITKEEWEQRAATWEEVCLKNHNGRRLYFEIVACQTGMDSFELEREITSLPVS